MACGQRSKSELSHWALGVCPGPLTVVVNLTDLWWEVLGKLGYWKPWHGKKSHAVSKRSTWTPPVKDLNVWKGSVSSRGTWPSRDPAASPISNYFSRSSTFCIILWNWFYWLTWIALGKHEVIGSSSLLLFCLASNEIYRQMIIHGSGWFMTSIAETGVYPSFKYISEFSNTQSLLRPLWNI